MLIGFLVSAQVAMRALKKQFWELGEEVLQDSSTQINLSLVDSSKERMVWGWLKRAMSSTWWAIILQRRQWQSWRDNEPRRLETNWSFLTQIIDASWIGFCEGVCSDGEISWSRYQDPKVGFARDILFMIGKHAHVPWLDDWIDCFLQLFIWKKHCLVLLRLWRKRELRPWVVWYDCYHFQLGLIVFCLIHCKFMQICLPGSLQCRWHESLGL